MAVHRLQAVSAVVVPRVAMSSTSQASASTVEAAQSLEDNVIAVQQRVMWWTRGHVTVSIAGVLASPEDSAVVARRAVMFWVAA